MNDNHGRRNRIDWDSAFAFYASMPRGVRSYGKVARRFEVSDTAVRKHASSRAWLEKVAALDARTDEKIAARVVRDRSERVADTLNAIDLASQQVLARLQAGDLRVDAGEFVNLVKLGQLLEGEPTGRVEVVEVRRMFQAVFVVVAKYVPVERRREFLEEFNAAAGEQFALAAGGEGEDS